MLLTAVLMPAAEGGFTAMNPERVLTEEFLETLRR